MGGDRGATRKNSKINDITMSFKKPSRKIARKHFQFREMGNQGHGGSRVEKAVPTAVSFIILVCQGRGERKPNEIGNALSDWFRSKLTRNSFYLKLSIIFILRNGSIRTAFHVDSSFQVAGESRKHRGNRLC